MESELTIQEILNRLRLDYNDEFVHSHYRIVWFGGKPKNGHINISNFKFNSAKGLILKPDSIDWDYTYRLHHLFEMFKYPIPFGFPLEIFTTVEIYNVIFHYGIDKKDIISNSISELDCCKLKSECQDDCDITIGFDDKSFIKYLFIGMMPKSKDIIIQWNSCNIEMLKEWFNICY